MRRHKPVGGVRVLMLLPALGQHEFLVRLQHRELADLLEVAGEAAGAPATMGSAFVAISYLSLRFRLGSKRLLLLVIPRRGRFIQRKHAGHQAGRHGGQVLKDTINCKARCRVPSVTDLHVIVRISDGGRVKKC